MKWVPWPEEKKERLSELWAKGHLAREISDMMDITKGAVVGQANRMGLAARRAGFLPKPAPAPVSASEPASSAPSGAVHLLDRTDQQCKFPLWAHDEAPTMMYCGQLRMHGQSYCKAHCLLCYPGMRAAG